MADLNDVLLALGRVQAGVDRLREDFTEEKRASAESRRLMYQKQDDLVAEVEGVKREVLAVQMSQGQLVEDFSALEKSVAQHKARIEPAVEDWQRIKTIGLGASGLVGLGGASIAGFFIYAGEASASAVRRWLGIE